MASRKRVEPIRFGKTYFPISIAEFSLNIRIFLEKFGSAMKKYDFLNCFAPCGE